MDDRTHDLIIVGSGAGGLTAAITAASKGASVLVIEKSEYVGGTSAVSGGLLWVPGYRRDSHTPAEIVRYIETAAAGEIDQNTHSAVEVFVEEAAKTMRFLEKMTPLRLRPVNYPDSFAELDGGVRSGRHYDAAPFRMSRLGRRKDLVRPDSSPQIVTVDEAMRLGFVSNTNRAISRNFPMLAFRRALGYRTMGGGLIGALLKGCDTLGVQILTEAEVTGLKVHEGRITGVSLRKDSDTTEVVARKGVILAAGGFEWDDGKVQTHLGQPIAAPPSPPLAVGAGLTLLADLDIELDNMNDAWFWPVGAVPGQTYDGVPTGTLILAERCMPHCFWVNASGQRFVNESGHNCALALREAGNTPCWSVFDSQFRSKYSILGAVSPDSPDPDWLIRAETLAGLAAKLDIDAEQLVRTAESFNASARDGSDPLFSRGQDAYDLYCGDQRAAHPNLGPVEKPPFYAIRIFPSVVGTKGGPRTSPSGQVLGRDAIPISGLYAVGNTSHAVPGPRSPAGGITIASAMTTGRLAALSALGANSG